MALTFLDERKIPFDATGLGVAVNTIKGLPRAALEVGKDIGQSIARNIASVGATIAKKVGGVDELSTSDIKSPFGQELFRNFFGGELIKPIEDRIAQAELSIKTSPFAQKTGLDKVALPLAFGGIMGTVALDLTPFGGLERNAVKQLVKTTSKKETAKILKSMGVSDNIASDFSPHFASAKTEEEVLDVLNNMKGVIGTKQAAETTRIPIIGTIDSATGKITLNRGETFGLNKVNEIASTGKNLAEQFPTTEGAETLQKTTQEVLVRTNQAGDSGAFSLPKSIASLPTPVNKKVHILDYARTPDRVLTKIGLGKEADFLRVQYDKYVKELPENIEKITQWSKQVSAESNARIFKWLDGQDVQLFPEELKVGNEIKAWLAEWAERLKLPKDKRIAEYITHIFDDQLIRKEFDEDLAKIIADKVPRSVYNPFLLERLGAKGYIEDTWKALDAYVKRATRKVHLDPALERIEESSKTLEKSQWDFVKRYTDRINLRPTDWDTLLDNGVKNLIGYRFVQRPVAAISRFLRQMTYRAMLGLNLSSALKNLSQGINTYAKLGERYTLTGYTKLFSSGAREELVREGVLNQGFIQDRVLSTTRKLLEKADKTLFFFFENAERINRGAAYWGAKTKALAQGKTEEQAIEIAKKLVRDTQFTFGSIDTPVILQSDIGKTLGQFQSFTIKQIEFLTEMMKNKEFVGLLRYAVSGLAFVYTIGKAFGMEPKDLIPAWRIGVPPSLKLPVETARAFLDTPNKYGQQRGIEQKLRDVGRSTVGLIPAGTQAKKTIEGIQSVREGKSTTRSGRTQFRVGGTPAKDIQAFLFGKYVSPEAKAYFNPQKKRSTLTF